MPITYPRRYSFRRNLNIKYSDRSTLSKYLNMKVLVTGRISNINQRTVCLETVRVNAIDHIRNVYYPILEGELMKEEIYHHIWITRNEKYDKIGFSFNKCRRGDMVKFEARILPYIRANKTESYGINLIP